MKKRLLHYTLAVLLLLTGLPVATQSVRAATYTVTNTNDSGAGSLRQAIIDTNNNPGPDTIAFNIPKSDQTQQPSAHPDRRQHDRRRGHPDGEPGGHQPRRARGTS
jgi:hypothetical protein